MKRLLGAWMSLSIALLGCRETVSSKNVRTGGIAMLTMVAASSDQTDISTELLVGGDESNTDVVLDTGDQLVAYADGERKVMSEGYTDGVYEADFDVVDEGVEFEVMLEREQDETAGARGVLPAPFEITSDFGSRGLSRGRDSFEITWEPPREGERMQIEFYGCVERATQHVPDDGSHLVRAGSIKANDTYENSGCQLQAALSRRQGGTIDRAFDDESRFTILQERRLTFQSEP
jgi:hypothetical protein